MELELPQKLPPGFCLAGKAADMGLQSRSTETQAIIRQRGLSLTTTVCSAPWMSDMGLCSLLALMDLVLLWSDEPYSSTPFFMKWDCVYPAIVSWKHVIRIFTDSFINKSMFESYNFGFGLWD